MIRFLVDSSSDLNKDYLEENNIEKSIKKYYNNSVQVCPVLATG